jgi:protein TonB
MEIKQLKLDFLSVLLSLFFHFLFFVLFHVSSSLSVKSYEVIDLDVFSVDTNVKSKLLSTVSNMGKDYPHSDSIRTEFPHGSKTKRSVSRGGASAKYSGKIKASNVNFSKSTSVGSSKQDSRDVGDVFANFSITNSEENGSVKIHSNVKSRYDKVAPYVLKIKKRIKENWKNPYTGLSSRKVVIVKFEILKDGSMRSFSIEKLSNDTLFNRTAVNAIYSSQPFPSIPEGIKVKKVKLRIKFEAE